MLGGVGLALLGVEAGEGERGGKGLDLLAESGNLNIALKSSNKVLHQLAASLGLDSESNLHNAVQEVANLDKVGLLEGARGQGRGSETNTTGSDGRDITADRVLVEGDLGNVADALDLGAGELEGAKIPEDQVVVRTVGLDLVAVADQVGGKGLRVGNDLLGIELELGAGGLLEGNGDGGNGVVVGTSLDGGEDSLVDTALEVLTLLDLGILVLAEEDQSGTGTTEGLVGGGGDNVAVLEGRFSLLASNKTGNVGHVAHEVGAVLVSNLAEAGIVPLTGVSRGTADEDLGAEELGILLESVEIDETGGDVDLVGHGLEVDGGGRDLLLGSLVAVGQVTTGGEVETHDAVLGLDHGGQGSKVGGGSRVRLDVDTPLLGRETEGLKGTLAAEVLDHINVLVATVVTGTRETLRVLVGQGGSVGLHDGLRGEVLYAVVEMARGIMGSVLLVVELLLFFFGVVFVILSLLESCFLLTRVVNTKTPPFERSTFVVSFLSFRLS